MNKLKSDIPANGKKKKKGKVKPTRKYMRFFNFFDIIKKDDLVNMMPFVFFLTSFAIVYIANSYMAEKTLRNINTINKELKTLRSEHLSLKSELSFKSKQSTVAMAVKPFGLNESIIAPRKIVFQPNTESKEDN
jgi:Bacteriodetes cell division protein (FtsL-like)